METTATPECGNEEHAVITRFRLASGGFGDAGQRALDYEAKQVMATAVREARSGEADGNEFGGAKSWCTPTSPMPMLSKVMEPTLRGLLFRPAHVVLRRGDSELRVDL
ncbi:hypothetical protein HEP87_11515 [Streptomyces sp. S1D4-11]|nr:hypothetical protein [Streptomyces sp. S1D4-11]